MITLKDSHEQYTINENEKKKKNSRKGGENLAVTCKKLFPRVRVVKIYERKLEEL